MLIKRITVLAVCVWLAGCVSPRRVPTPSPPRDPSTSAAARVPAIDPFFFLAGLCANGIGREYNVSPQCESFFRESGETRPAELFLDAARMWNRGITTHYYEPDGKRLVILNAPLSEALHAFYQPDAGSENHESLGLLLTLERPKRLSFLAGVYARGYQDGTMHGLCPSPAMQAAIFILLAEGCQISNMDYRENEIPNTIHFEVKPSEAIARLFAAVDRWRPPHVEWKTK